MQTSLAAWNEVRKDLTNRQKEVLTALQAIGGQGTMHEVSMRMMVPLHRISGRFSELEKQNRIEVVGIDKCGMSRRAVYRVR